MRRSIDDASAGAPLEDIIDGVECVLPVCRLERTASRREGRPNR
jgi:hypothetical protein